MRNRHKIPLLLFSVITIIIAIGILIPVVTSLPEKQVNSLLDLFVKSKTGIDIHVEKLNRNWWDYVELTKVNISFRHEDTVIDLVSIESVMADYSLFELAKGKLILDSLIINRPVFYLKRDNYGEIIFPGRSENEENNNQGFMPGLIIGSDKIKLIDGLLKQSDDDYVENINFIGTLGRIPPETFYINIDSLSFVYPYKDFSLNHLSSKAKFTPGNLYLEHLELKTGESDASGMINLRYGEKLEYDFDLEGDNISFEELSRMAGIKLQGDIKYHIVGGGNREIVHGKAVLSGLFFERNFDNVETGFEYKNGKLSFSNISGKIFNSPISGNGWIDLSVKPEKYFADTKIRNLNLSNIIFNSLDTDFNGGAVFSGSGLISEDLAMSFSVNLNKTRVEKYRLDRAIGNFDVNTKFIMFKDGFKANYKNTDVVFNGPLEYSGNVRITGNAQFKDLNDFDDQIFLTDIGGIGEADFMADGPTKDFNLYGTFKSDSSWIYGIYAPSLNIGLSLNSFVAHPEGEVKFGWTGGEIYSLPINTAKGDLIVAGDYTFIDSLRIQYDAGDCWLSGKYDGTVNPNIVSLDSVFVNISGNKISNEDDIILMLDENDVTFSEFNLKASGGEVKLHGSIDYDDNMELSLKVNNSDILPYASLIDLQNRWDGLLSCDLIIRGNFDLPYIGGQVKIDKLGYNFYNLGNVVTDFEYSENTLNISSFDLSDSLDNFWASGFIPINLSFAEVENRIPDSSFYVDINATGQQLNIITAFIPQVEYLYGDFNARLLINNTIHYPTFSGELKLSDGVLKIRDFVEPIYDLNCNINLQNKNIELEKVTGKFDFEGFGRSNIFNKIWSKFKPSSKKKGELGISGNIDVKSFDNFNYDLSVTGSNIPLIHEVYDVYAISDIELKVTGPTPPIVSGEADLVQFIYSEPFASSEADVIVSEAQHAVEVDLWDLDVNVKADNNIWVINPDMDAEFEGDVHIERRLGLYRIQGEIGTIRGRYYLPPLMNFNIDAGRITFNDPEFVSFNSIDPELDVLASERIIPTDDKGAPTGEKEITLTVIGRLSEPELELSSDGDTDQEIIEFLAFRRQLNGNSDASQTSIGDRGVGLFSDLISSQIKNQARKSLGVETLEIRPSQTGGFDLGKTRISVGKYISSSVYLKYSTLLSATSGQEIAAEYRLNRNFSLEARSDDENLYHLDLNFKIEFK
ncbi:MAG: hypothetical protein GY855_09615 [candidate division Zixibacteria bacterium]|nr:hypothetical protein [candidate division Zixibacteria bacterium]